MITVKSNGRIYIDGKKSNFFVYEFVAPEIYIKWGNRAIRYIEESIILAAQFLRTELGLPITICDYNGGGAYKDSGTRTKESYDRMYGTDKGLAKYLATYSMHKFCGAADLKIGTMSSHQMAEEVEDMESELMAIGIKRIENPDKTKGRNRDWLHMDTAITGLDYIVKVNP